MIEKGKCYCCKGECKLVANAIREREYWTFGVGETLNLCANCFLELTKPIEVKTCQ